MHLAGVDDEEIAEAVDEALAMAATFPEEDYEEEAEGFWSGTIN